MRNRAMLAGAFGLLLALALIAGLTVPALAQPTAHTFWGTVTINDNPAPEGTVISAQIGGVEYGLGAVEAGGAYGNVPNFVVTAPEGLVGQPISFYVGTPPVLADTYIGGELVEEVLFEFLGATNLDLVVGDAPTPTPTPTVQVTPDNGPRGSQVTVTGSGWVPNSAVTLNFAGSPTTVVADANGNIVAALMVPATAVTGANTVTAADTLGNAALPATFTVPGAAISVDPQEGGPGTAVTVSGTGFAGYAPITITFGGYQFPSQPLSSPLGDFTYSATVPGVALGSQVVQAFDGTRVATTFFIVLAASTPTPTPTYTLTMQISGSGITNPVVGVHTYAAGTVVNISAAAHAGWKFDMWTGGVADPLSPDTTVTMNSGKSVTAVFSQVPSTPTPTPGPGPYIPPTTPTPTPPLPPVMPTPPPVDTEATVDLSGVIDEEGVVQEDVQESVFYGWLEISVGSGTEALTERGEPLQEIAVEEICFGYPPPPANAYVVGCVYDFGPEGATFDPPITITLHYDPGLIPEGVAEKDLKIALYDATTGQWTVLESFVVDTENNTITAQVSGFTMFAVYSPAPPVTPTPTPPPVIPTLTPPPSPTPTTTPAPIPTYGDDGEAFPLYIIGAAVGGLVVIGASTGYLWRRRKEALLIRRYKQKLDQWEQEGYDVSDFKKKWFRWFE